VNNAGMTVGTYHQAPTDQFGYFIGDHDGVLETSVEVHGKAAAVDAFNRATGISFLRVNGHGAVAGSLQTLNDNFRGFLIDPKGKVQLIDVPGADVEAGLGTWVNGLNGKGDVVGYAFVDRIQHGFLETHDSIV
jgi:hypothetical protein